MVDEKYFLLDEDEFEELTEEEDKDKEMAEEPEEEVVE